MSANYLLFLSLEETINPGMPISGAFCKLHAEQRNLEILNRKVDELVMCKLRTSVGTQVMFASPFPHLLYSQSGAVPIEIKVKFANTLERYQTKRAPR